MDDPKRLEAKGLARAKIRAKRRRVSSIRSRTIRGSLALFAVAWAIVFGQLVTGNDPALSHVKVHKSRASTDRSHERPRAQPIEAPQEETDAVAPVEEEAVPVEEEALPETEATPEFEEPEPEFVPEPEPESAPVITSSS